MLGYDVEIFEANGEKTISTSYPNIYILLTSGATELRLVLQLPEPAEVGVRFCKLGERQYHSAKLDTEDSDTEDSDMSTSSRPTVN
jgi:hypothetical protein